MSARKLSQVASLRSIETVADSYGSEKSDRNTFFSDKNVFDENTDAT